MVKLCGKHSRESKVFVNVNKESAVPAISPATRFLTAARLALPLEFL